MVKPMEKKDVAYWLTKIKTNFMMNHKIGDSWEGFKALDSAIEQAKHYPDIQIVDNVLVIDLSGVDVEVCVIKEGSGQWSHFVVKHEDTK